MDAGVRHRRGDDAINLDKPHVPRADTLEIDADTDINSQAN